MQKLFQSCYAMDRKCYEKYGLTEDILMEHAAEGMARIIRERFEADAVVLIAAGPGNNGADGIALARLLCSRYDVKLWIPLGARSEMAKLQLGRAESVGIVPVSGPGSADVVVDALFGAGLSRPLSDEIVSVVEALNAMNGFKMACDIPTGLDESGRVSPLAFSADITVTMGALKESLYSDEAKDHIGDVLRVDLGVERVLYEDESNTFLLEKSDFVPPLREKLKSHKGSYGHAAIFCGEKEGAGIIAACAAARFGAGLTTVVVHEHVTPPPFLMHATSVPSKTTALAVGMGLGEYFEKDMLRTEVVDSVVPVVLDADAFYREDLMEVVHQQEREIIVTPHPKEFAAMWKILTGEELSAEDVQKNRFETVRRFCSAFPNIVLLLKGANMLIGKGERLFVNPLGSPVLAKGGSGDVLSGLIAALLAQGYGALDAAMHGSLALAITAGRWEGSSFSMLSVDLVEMITQLKDQ